MALQLPTVHLNGTGRQELVEQAKACYTALQDALDTMAKARPHGRDYYVQGDNSVIEAGNQHAELYIVVQNIQQEYAEYAIGIQKAGL